MIHIWSDTFDMVYIPTQHPVFLLPPPPKKKFRTFSQLYHFYYNKDNYFPYISILYCPEDLPKLSKKIGVSHGENKSTVYNTCPTN